MPRSAVATRSDHAEKMAVHEGSILWIVSSNPHHRLECKLIESRHGQLQMFLHRVLDLVVADAVKTLHEHHDGGNAGACDFGGVVEGAGGEAIGERRLFRRSLSRKGRSNLDRPFGTVLGTFGLERTISAIGWIAAPARDVVDLDVGAWSLEL